VEKSLEKIPTTLLKRKRSRRDAEAQLISRPDIIIFPKIKPDDIDNNTAPEEKQAIFLEISYCGDGYVAERYEAKLLQHKEHADSQIQEGWTVQVVPIIITYSGCITNTLRTTLTALGIAAGPINKLIAKLHQHTCTFNYKTIRTYRYLKQEAARQDQTGIG
jgi:hypothetical protein